jgi:DNA polymerase II small subunit/DNA polymerase delta subunit B
MFFKLAMLTSVQVKHSGAMRDQSNCYSPYSDIYPMFSSRVPRLSNMINYIFSTQLHLSNGKLLS